MRNGTITSGDMRTPITIERDDTVRTATGAKGPAWTTPATVANRRALMEAPTMGREAQGRDTPVSAQQYHFTLWRDNVSIHPKHRVKIVERGITRYFEIEAIVATQGRFQKLITTEVF